MTHAEALEVLSYLFGCYIVGWCAAYFIHVLKIFIEKI